MRGATGLMWLACVVMTTAQTPQPFPTPRSGATPPPPAPPVSAPAPTTTSPAPAPQAAAVPQPPAAPGAPDLGEIPVYPSAVYLTSYEAGRGQRFYIYGVPLTYEDTVNYYRAALKQRGDQLFEVPGTHQFELGRFRDSEMAFPPTVTVKDYTFGGGSGYVNPIPGATPTHFPTIVQIVPR